MLSSFPISVVIGTVLGFLAGLGIGGGSLLILWLTLVIGFSQEIARGINLMFFIPAAFFSSFLRLRQGMLPWKPLLPAVAAGCICAGLAAWFSGRIELDLLKKAFGVLLLFTGIRELLYKPKKPKAE